MRKDVRPRLRDNDAAARTWAKLKDALRFEDP